MGASIAEIPNVLGIFDFSAPAYRDLDFLAESEFSECCFRLNGIFSRELSRSLVDKWLLVRTPIASDPPNRSSNYPTVGLTVGRYVELTLNIQTESLVRGPDR